MPSLPSICFKLALFGCSLLVSCSKSNNVDQSTTASDVGKECGAEGELPCRDGSTCVLGYCRTPCSHDADCDEDATCVGAGEFGCSLAWELGCSSAQPCDAPLSCDPNGAVGACRNACTETSDCELPEYSCVDDVCVPPP